MSKIIQRQARVLLTISVIFAMSVALSNTFVNVYLWKVDHSYMAIGRYNLLVYMSIPVAFIIAGRTAKRVGTVWALRIGVTLHAVFYALTLFGGERVAAHPSIMGAVMGTAAGFYWFAFNMLSLEFTSFHSRDRFNGLNGALGAVAGMLAPPLSGFLIQFEDRFGGLSGYHLIFGLSFGLFIGAVVATARLHAKRTGGHLRLGMAMRTIKVRSWRMLLVGCFVYGLREGVFLFLIGLLMFIASGSELRLGEFLFLQSALMFGSYFLVSKRVKPNHRLNVMGIGVITMALAALIFLFPLSPLMITAYGIIIALGLPLFLVPLQSFVFDSISALRSPDNLQMENVIIREIFENMGRVGGIGLFILWIAIDVRAQYIQYFALMLGFVQIATFVSFKIGGVATLVSKQVHAGHDAQAFDEHRRLLPERRVRT